ncbi:VRR-NUC domain-containing protein [Virgibacillus sp. AGTR]|uniref:VRR-NUC domain-containing protein n=1 Tax=Virgibacillus sp. AGTR TaxID=2812055 RepID=UPI001D161CC1|nr:VRR-NUC domain-containing protein [Virgibacillus sp. AGTR]MCC2248930.1 VRR-NUC domain-containing protein [Virgibacillus sp. AGTR]
MSKNPRESKIETYLKEQIKAVGGLCYKWKSTVNGVPDQIVIFDGNVHFIEVKRPGEKPRANQIIIHEKIQKQSVPVYTIDTEASVDAFIKDVLSAEPKMSSKPRETIIKSKNQFKHIQG